MSKAEVLSKGQITIPKEVRNELQLSSGDIVVFQTSIHDDVKITKGFKNENNLDCQAVVTKKGQITIPKKIRTKLLLEKADIVIFNYFNSNIFIRKQGLILPCPACSGFGSFEEFGLPCFVCDQSSYIEKNEMGILFLLIFNNKFRKYKVGNTIIQQEIGKNGMISYRQFPKLILRSNQYPEELLNKIQDTLQMILLEEHVPKSIYDDTKFMIPNDAQLKEILDLFVTVEIKSIVKEWFKYSRTI